MAHLPGAGMLIPQTREASCRGRGIRAPNPGAVGVTNLSGSTKPHSGLGLVMVVDVVMAGLALILSAGIQRRPHDFAQQPVEWESQHIQIAGEAVDAVELS